MKLAQRFYIAILPVIILSTVINFYYAWHKYNQRIEDLFTVTMEKSFNNFKLYSQTPLFLYYFKNMELNYIEDADRDLRDIQNLYVNVVEREKRLLHFPKHLALYDKNWNIIVENFPLESNSDHLPKTSHLEAKEIDDFNSFFNDTNSTNQFYSVRHGNNHKLVRAITKNLNYDNVLTNNEVLGYLHMEYTLPVDKIFSNTQDELWNNFGMAILQIVLLSLAFFWIGRFVPRPFERFANQLLKLPEQDSGINSFNRSNIHELNIVGNALQKMNQDICRKQEELIAARDQAKNHERMLLLILDTIPVRVFWKNLAGKYLGCNIHFAKAAGFKTIQEVISKSDHDLCWKLNAKQFQAQDALVVKERSQIINMEMLQKDCSNEERWIEINKVPLMDGNQRIIGVLGTSYDVTPKKKAQEERDRFFMLSPDIMCTLGSNRNFKLVNPALQQKTRLSNQGLLKVGLPDITHPDDRAAATEFVNQLLDKNQSVVIERDFRLFEQGAQGDIIISWSAIAKGGDIYAVGRDITAWKNAELELQRYTDNLEQMIEQRTRELAHAERLASLGTFAAGMAHEINNPNSFIAGNIDFLKQFWSISRPILDQHQNDDSTGRVGAFLDEITETLNGMLDGSQRISKIVDSLKAYSKGGMETDKVECRLIEPIQDSQYLLQHRIKKGFALTIEVPSNIVVICDRQQLTQVFVNLLNNSMDALESTHDQKDNQMSIRAELIDEHIWIRVLDNGPGIPHEAIGKIFDPFYTSKGKTKGTGLGLSIVHGIVTDHSGQITVYSSGDANEGTEFLMILPSRESYQKIQRIRGKK